jgi:hypothetical protein
MRNWQKRTAALLLCPSFLLAQSQAPTATIGAVSLGHIAPPPPGYAFPLNQTYDYVVEWHLFTAGVAHVKMESAGTEHKVSATGESTGVVNALFGVHDRFESRFDPRTFCSLRVWKHSEEGSHKRETSIRFDYSRGKSVLDEKNLKTGESKHTENDIPSCVTDVITGFYYLASLPLQVGGSYTLAVNDGGKTTQASAQVEAREKIKAPSGTYNTLRVSVEALSGPLQNKGRLWVWYTDDAAHTPVQMRAKLSWGTLLFRMTSLEKQ